ncbi:MAG: carbohydrate ABC transporter permease [Negativicutes bacterium]|jgi:multiple sugar transport system permease protein
MNKRESAIRKNFIRVCFYILIGTYALIALFPFVWAFITSLKPTAEANNFSIPLDKMSFDNYLYIMKKFPYLRWFANSLAVCLGVTIGSIFINSLAGYALARMNFKGRKVMFWLVLAMMMVPVQVLLVPQYVILAKLGWINTYQGLIVPYLFSCFGTFMMRQFFLSIPRSLEEAAMIDGAGRFTIFWKIIFPLAKPAVAAQFILTFVGMWNEFLWPSLIAKRQEMYTLTVGLNSFYNQYAQYWDQIQAGVMLLSIPAVAIFIIFQKQFVEGMTMGAVKE